MDYKMNIIHEFQLCIQQIPKSMYNIRHIVKLSSEVFHKNNADIIHDYFNSLTLEKQTVMPQYSGKLFLIQVVNMIVPEKPSYETMKEYMAKY